MRKIFLSGVIALQSLIGFTQFTQNDVIYYVGTGPDTAVLIIDFVDGSADPSYAWGYLFDAAVPTTGGDMLQAIAADEPKLNIAIGGGFLSNIIYNTHIGAGGDPNFWETWSRTDGTIWEVNGGLSEGIANGDWFGCSYTDLMPAVEPEEPIAAYKSTKFTAADVQFWVGAGSDSAVFVIDFITPLVGQAVTYAWGYLFDGTTDGGTMLNDLNAADVNLDVDAGAFLNDILFNDLAGIGGAPYYWLTWSGTNLSDWVINAGLATTVSNGDWFGCAYGDWPARRPFYPIAAIDSAAYLFSNADFFAGSGENKVVVVIDFNEWNPGESFAFGYNFDTETVTAEEALNAITAHVPYGISIDLTGGFLNDIVSTFGYSGIVGAPNYWSTWSAKNVGGWEMNMGISEILSNGDWFAATYTTWSPATPPSVPQNANYTVGISESENEQLKMYPNPAKDFVFVEFEKDVSVEIITIQGQVVAVQNYSKGLHKIDVSTLDKGVYFLSIADESIRVNQRLIVQ